MNVLTLDPIPELLTRVRGELAAQFDATKPIRISRAPGRLDVMGGIADYTGAQVCEYPLECAAAVALQERDDRQVQVFSFNLLDEHKPFTFGMSLDALAEATIDQLRAELAADANRRWAGYLIGCLSILQDANLIDLRNSHMRGLNLAILSTVPLGVGVSSSAAIEVATMMNLIEQFGLRDKVDGVRVADLCQQVENRIVGAPCGIMDQVTSCLGEVGMLLRMQCQPHTVLPPLKLPAGIRVVGINSNVKHSVGGGQYGRTRCAAFMAHRIIIEHMRTIGRSQNRELEIDPMDGYLANLDPEDYKQLFRHKLPNDLRGSDFLSEYGATIDTVTQVEPDTAYAVQHAADHHVLEARRVQHFASFLEQATSVRFDDGVKKSLLDKAGHLMYASHLSYTNDAMLGAPECDLLVDLVRQREALGLYGAKITGGGEGGTVAVLCNDDSRSSIAIADVMARYEEQTSKKPLALVGTSPGAWGVGTVVQSQT